MKILKPAAFLSLSINNLKPKNVQMLIHGVSGCFLLIINTLNI